MTEDTLDFYTARWRRQLIGDVARIFEETAEAAEAEILKLIHICEYHAGEVAAVTGTALKCQLSRPRQR